MLCVIQIMCLFPTGELNSKLFLFPFQDIKSKKTKNKKGEVADGKKKAKKEPEEKWKWLVIHVCQAFAACVQYCRSAIGATVDIL